jgi:hypothetical protein
MMPPLSLVGTAVRQRENPQHLFSVLIILLLGSTTVALAAPQLAACANDRQRLCNDFIGKPSEMQRCMRTRRAEWSEACALAVKGRSGETTKVSQTRGDRRAQCAAYVQAKYLQMKGVDHQYAARAELKRCMQGEPMDNCDTPLCQHAKH